MIDAINRFVGGAIKAVLLAISWAVWITLALAVVVGLIALGAATPPIWIVIILLILIWLK